jgi:hypothetical protein
MLRATAKSGRDGLANALIHSDGRIDGRLTSEDRHMSNDHGKGQGGSEGGNPGKGQAGADKVRLTIVVNGTPTEIEQNVNSPLRAVIERALAATGNDAGQPVENWELRDEQGVLLEPDRKIGSFGFAGAATLFLSLKAGVGGC